MLSLIPEYLAKRPSCLSGLGYLQQESITFGSLVVSVSHFAEISVEALASPTVTGFSGTVQRFYSTAMVVIGSVQLVSDWAVMKNTDREKKKSSRALNIEKVS